MVGKGIAGWSDYLVVIVLAHVGIMTGFVDESFYGVVASIFALFAVWMVLLWKTDAIECYEELCKIQNAIERAYNKQ